MEIRAKDYNQNGSVDAEDVELFNTSVRNWGQLAIAWISLLFMIILTVILCFDVISIERMKVLEGLLTTIYIAFSSLVGAQMGLTAWMKK